MNRKVLLVILDGFGHSQKKDHNAIFKATMPNWRRYLEKYPHSLIKTSGLDVGLPDGIMGNSEVGHMTIGSGRILYQDLVKVNKFIEEEGFEKHKMIQSISKSQETLHLIGLLSDGGVHSHIDHLISLITSVKKLNSDKEIAIHCIMDGRDTPPTSGKSYLQKLEKEIGQYSDVNVSTISGRFYAMDRDKRWERIELAYNMMSGSTKGNDFSTSIEAIENAYTNDETDEFIVPRKVKNTKSIQTKDEVLFFNYRADRAREISTAFCDANFKAFKRTITVDTKNWYTMTQYQESFVFPVLFPKEIPKETLGEVVSRAGLKQLRCAETEKYAHVTYFLNGGEESAFKNESRILVDSPKDVKTYDEKPEMSAFEVTEKLIESMGDDFSLIVVNYANGDMVGHTGNETAAIKALEALDKCLGELESAAIKNSFDILVTADHGNVEEMVDEKSQKPFTQHTTNPVPLLWISEKQSNQSLKNGGLADIAPTVLELMSLQKPKVMTGESLIKS